MIRQGLGLLLAAGFAALILHADPAKSLTLPALLGMAQPALVALLAVAAALGAGGALRGSRPTDPLLAFALGMGLHGAIMLVFALFGLGGPAGGTLSLALLGLGWLRRPKLVWPAWTPLFLIGALLLVPGLIDALAPRTDTDELYYHLALPRRIAETGHLAGGFELPDGSRPLPVHLVYAALYGLGGVHAPPLYHLLLCVALLVGLRTIAERHFGPGRGDLPALLLLGSWSFLREAGLAYNNLPVAMWLLVAADAVLTGQRALGGWLCGLALAGKYTAAPVVAGLLLVAGPRAWLPMAPGLLLPLVPWWLRNLAGGLHPLFPYTGWPQSGFTFMYLEKYGMGRDALALLKLPWNVLVHADPTSPAFLGRISPAWAGAGLAGLWAALRVDRTPARALVVVVGIGLIGWASGPHWLRYLLPLCGVAALAAGATRLSAPLLLLLLVGVPSNLGPLWIGVAERLAVVGGRETEDAFLARNLPAWPALAYLREHVPPDAPVALLFSWHGLYLPQPTLLGSVEDHVPTRYWLDQHGDRALIDLAQRGVRYVLVGERPFLRKSYSFLDDATWKKDFQAPVDQLENLLLRDATRLYTSRHYSVWQLELER